MNYWTHKGELEESHHALKKQFTPIISVFLRQLITVYRSIGTLIIVGLREGNYLFPQPTHGPDSPDQEPFYSSGEAVKGLITSEPEAGIRDAMDTYLHRFHRG
jgi:hypothetical protein